MRTAYRRGLRYAVFFTLILQFEVSKIILFLVFQKLQAPIVGLFPKVSTLHPISVLLWVGRIFFVPGEIELRYDKF